MLHAAPPARRGIIDEARRIAALAWPVALTGLNWTILHITDVIVVGMSGEHQVAALSASRAITFVGIVVAIGLMTGVIVGAARADGAGDTGATGRVFHEGLLLSLLLGVVSGAALHAVALPALRIIGVDPGIAPDAAEVVRAMAFAYPFQLPLIAASFFLEGISRPRRVTVVNLAILPLNAVLAWAWAGGHLGLPAWGAVGAAAATVIASVIGAIGMLAAVWTLPDAAKRGVRTNRTLFSRACFAGAGRLLVFGAMPALASALELAGFSILIALSTRFGEVSAHAFQIVFSIHNVTFALALGLGSAAGVRAGNAVGEGVPHAARDRSAIAATLAAALIGLLSVAILLFARPLTALFPATSAVHALASAMLGDWAPFILFDGVQVVFVYALRSLGDQVMAGVNGIIAYFAVTGGLGWWLVQAGHGPLALVWASAAGMVIAALLHGARLWQVTRRA